MVRDRNTLVDTQAKGLGATKQVGLCSTPHSPAMTRSKPGIISGDQRRMILSSTPHHYYANSFCIMAFPVERLSWYAAVCLGFSFYFLHNVWGNIGFHHHPKCLFATLAAVVSPMQSRDRPNNCIVVEVKWLFQDHIRLYRLCFLHFTYSTFVFYA